MDRIRRCLFRWKGRRTIAGQRVAMMSAAFALCFVASARAQTTWHVSASQCPDPGSGTNADPFCGIQDAVNASGNNDTVLVRAGLYVENLVVADKAITLKSVDGPWTTIVQSAVPGKSVIEIRNLPAPFGRVEGFTFRGGDSLLGGGMIMIHTQATIDRCVFRDNVAFRGGGFFNFGSFPVITNSLFVDNAADDKGGAFYNDHGFGTLINCTVVRNNAVNTCGGLFLSSTSLVRNTVVWDNADPAGTGESAQIFFPPAETLDITHSCVAGLSRFAGPGNIGADPLFIDPDVDDLRLNTGSPCIDAGNNASNMLSLDLEGGARRVDDAATVDTGSGVAPIIDMGAFEFGDDCNGNGQPDDIDIQSGTSADCDGNDIPDECEPDCNDNDVADVCDINAGTSADCGANGIPDECEPDCNENQTADSCDLFLGTSDDCNGNLTPDECDIASGGSSDANGNQTPDECETPQVTVHGSRYLSVDPPASDSPFALHITSQDFPCLAIYAMADGSTGGAPVYRTSDEWGHVHVHGWEIVPGRRYEVRIELPGGFHGPTAQTTTWPFGETNNMNNVSFADISLIVAAFRGDFSQTRIESVDIAPASPNGIVEFMDVSMAVDAFRGLPYSANNPLPCE